MNSVTVSPAYRSDHFRAQIVEQIAGEKELFSDVKSLVSHISITVDESLIYGRT